MRLLITGAISWNQEQKEELENLGHELIYIQDERVPLRQQGIEPESIEGTICNGLFLYNEIREFHSLKYIQLTSAGYDRVPLDYIKEHEIKIYNARGVYSVPMAEFAVGGVLQLYKQSRYFYSNQKKHQWKKHRGIMELDGKSVCIVGCGSVGQACAKCFSALGCSVFGIDVSLYRPEMFLQIDQLDTLNFRLRESDIVILTVPLTAETRGLMNRELLFQMKKGSILVNISRGAVVVMDDLVHALRENLAGAVLDVFEEEPLPENSPLWDMENVILTPHNSFVGENNRTRLQKVILNNLQLKQRKC